MSFDFDRAITLNQRVEKVLSFVEMVAWWVTPNEALHGETPHAALGRGVWEAVEYAVERLERDQHASPWASL